MGEQKPPAIYIRDLETLKVISDPLRLRIFQTICEASRNGEPCSVKQVSDALDIPPARLYYHIRLLEMHTILQVAETRLVSGILEKLYQPTAHRIYVSEQLLNAGAEAFYPVLSGVVKEVTEDLQMIMNTPQDQALSKGKDHPLLFSLERIQLTRVDEFEKKLMGLLEEMKAEPGDEGAPSFNFFYVLYPTHVRSDRKPPDE